MSMISVIVPIYNVEDYLEKCIDSILNQTYKDFELILVDDGSTDRSLSICRNFEKKDSRIVVLEKQNGGAADARNCGLDIAKGQYITFVDSDDMVDAEFLQEMFAAMQKFDVDIVNCEIKKITDDSFIQENNNKKKHYELRKGKDVCYDYYDMKWEYDVGPVAKLYKRNLFENVRFPSGKMYEDQGIVPILWYRAKQLVKIVNGYFYSYRIREGSMSHHDFLGREFDDVWCVEKCMSYFESQSDLKMTKKAKYLEMFYKQNIL